MKKAIVTFFLSLTLMLSLSVLAYAAGYSKLDNLTPGQAGYALVQTLHGTGNYVYNVSCSASSYSYFVTISYDSLSDICATANGVGMTCSLHYNAYAQVYVIAVDDRTTLGLTGTYGVIGNPDGYIYTAEYVDSGTDDIVDLLSAIRRFVSNMYGYVWGMDQGISGLISRVDGDFPSLLTTMNTHLENIETSLGVGVGTLGYNVQRTFTFISGPLYNTLLSVDTALNDPEESALLAKLDEIKSAIENISISADNVTVSAYNDTQLLSKLTEMSISLSNVEGILCEIWDVHNLKTSQLPRLLENIYSKLTSFSSLYETNSKTMIDRLEAMKVLLSPGTQEVPTTIYDWLERRIEPVSTQTYSSVSSLLSEFRSFSSRIGYANQRPLAMWVANIYSQLSTIQSAVENVSITADNITVDAYDDTNVIAAVNAVEAALANISFSGEVNTDLTAVVEGIGEVNTSLNVNLDSLVDKLDVLVDQSSESVENLAVDIAIDSDAYNVFYVTDEDGNEESIVDFSGDVLKAGGKLLNFLFRVCFDGAISNLDGSIDDMDSFYFDDAELGGSLWE